MTGSMAYFKSWGFSWFACILDANDLLAPMAPASPPSWSPLFSLVEALIEVFPTVCLQPLLWLMLPAVLQMLGRG